VEEGGDRRAQGERVARRQGDDRDRVQGDRLQAIDRALDDARIHVRLGGGDPSFGRATRRPAPQLTTVAPLFVRYRTDASQPGYLN